jgi:hypothetical protein
MLLVARSSLRASAHPWGQGTLLGCCGDDAYGSVRSGNTGSPIASHPAAGFLVQRDLVGIARPRQLNARRWAWLAKRGQVARLTKLSRDGP